MDTNFRWLSDQPILDSLPLNDLFDETVLDQHLSRLMNEFGSPTRAHAASITAKRLMSSIKNPSSSQLLKLGFYSLVFLNKKRGAGCSSFFIVLF